MKNFTSKLNGLVEDLSTVKILTRTKGDHLKSGIAISDLAEQHIKNWGKTSGFLPEIGENRLAISLYQLGIRTGQSFGCCLNHIAF